MPPWWFWRAKLDTATLKRRGVQLCTPVPPTSPVEHRDQHVCRENISQLTAHTQRSTLPCPAYMPLKNGECGYYTAR